MLTQARLKELFEYDANTGLFIRNKTVSSRAIVGRIAGCLNVHGYIQISVDGKTYKAHRMAWLYIFNYLPSCDNRICNLREASRSENRQNLKRSESNSTSKYLGVSWDKNRSKWKSDISIKGVKINIGHFESEEKAYEAYISYKRIIHPFGMI